MNRKTFGRVTNTVFRSALPSVAAALLIACGGGNGARTDSASNTFTPKVQIPLGDSATLVNLFSYPNNPDSNYTLAQTIQHYIRLTLIRDRSTGTVTVASNNGQFSATITADGAQQYASLLQQFLRNGKVAWDTAQAITARGQWHASWRSFLPLGLALRQQHSVQLLHFPPTSALLNMNYLGDATSQRWQDLLNVNGVRNDSAPLYEAIVDVAPIAAPDTAGNSLPVPPYVPYALAQLQLLVRGTTAAGSPTRPVVAYGGPARDWIAKVFKLPYLEVDSATLVKLYGNDTSQTAVLGANHPSYIWFLKDSAWSRIQKTMIQDLGAACWQVRMSATPGADPRSQIGTCVTYWTAPAQDTLVCVLIEEQLFDLDSTSARKKCPHRGR
jgi:hypothetical protein